MCIYSRHLHTCQCNKYNANYLIPPDPRVGGKRRKYIKANNACGLYNCVNVCVVYVCDSVSVLDC